MSNLALNRRNSATGVIAGNWANLCRSLSDPVPDSKNTKQIISRVLQQLKLPSVPNSISPTDIGKKLRSLPAHTLEYLDYTPRDYRDHSYLDRIVISALHNDASAVVVDDLAYLYKHMNFDISYYTTWTLRGFEGEITIGDVLRGIRSSNLRGVTYDFDGDTPLRFRNDDTGSKVLALIEVTSTLFDDFKDLKLAIHDDEAKTDTIADPVLAQLVVDKHDRLEELLSIMSTRKTADPEIISAIMDADASAMRDGVL